MKTFYFLRKKKVHAELTFNYVMSLEDYHVCFHQLDLGCFYFIWHPKKRDWRYGVKRKCEQLNWNIMKKFHKLILSIYWNVPGMSIKAFCFGLTPQYKGKLIILSLKFKLILLLRCHSTGQTINWKNKKNLLVLRYLSKMRMSCKSNDWKAQKIKENIWKV